MMRAAYDNQAGSERKAQPRSGRRATFQQASCEKGNANLKSRFGLRATFQRETLQKKNGNLHHGTNRMRHQSVRPTLGSFGRIHGPAADLRELEYISALHQNAEDLLRKDGTISSKDIGPYLSSRYGLKIAPEWALDIACGLCGAKARSKFSAEKDAKDHKVFVQSNRNLFSKDQDDDDGEEEEEEEEAFYFDIVQVMSLLLIPELLQLADHSKKRVSLTREKRDSVICDLSTPITFRSEEMTDKKDRTGGGADSFGIFKITIDSLTSFFDEETQKEIREGRAFDEGMLQQMLEAFGDVDSANDPKLLKQMLKDLGPKGSGLTVETFSRALTSDIGAYQTKVASNESKTSIFYDVFGRNWDEDGGEIYESGVNVEKTASYIDYAADTYRSKLHNTSVWCLFILTTLVYVTYETKWLQARSGGLLGCNQANFGCVVGNKVVGWLLTAAFCGFYGLFFLLPTSIGNQHKKFTLLCFSLAVTVFLIYAPFGALMWYKQGSPHNVTQAYLYREVCPAWVHPTNDTEEAYDPRYYLELDSDCMPAAQWCGKHTEVQGKYFDPNPDMLSYEEFTKCCRFSPQPFEVTKSSAIISISPTLNGTKNPDIHWELKMALSAIRTKSARVDSVIRRGSRRAPVLAIHGFAQINHGEELVYNLELVEDECLHVKEDWNEGDRYLWDVDCFTALRCMEFYNITKLYNISDPKNHHLKDDLLEAEYSIAHMDFFEHALDDHWTYYLLLCTAIVGVFAVISMIYALFRKNNNDDRPRDYRVKCAAASKIANLVENALSMHSVKSSRSSKGQATRNFFLHGEQVVEIGGLVWTLKQFWSGNLFSEEGICFPGRIWIGQVVQILVTIVGIAYGVWWIEFLGTKIDEIRALHGGFYYASVEGISDRDWATVTQLDLRLSQEAQEWLDWLPTSWMANAAGFSALVVASLVTVFCILVYIPSSINIILKLRNGTLSTLHDPYFQDYRKSPDNVVQNVGNMAFALMGSAVFTAIIVFGAVFVFLWPVTRDVLLPHVALLIGMLGTMIVKMVGQKLLRSRNFSAFYRTKAWGANLANLFFECWYIGTGLLVAVSRVAFFLVTGALWSGRLDSEFLHQNVKILGINLDQVPVSFKRDLLVHEAHNHPYIERLGGMYLLRLQDRSFGSVSGTTWRCLFAAGLMPWIVKYKVNSSQNVIFDAGAKLQSCYLMSDIKEEESEDDSNDEPQKAVDEFKTNLDETSITYNATSREDDSGSTFDGLLLSSHVCGSEKSDGARIGAREDESATALDELKQGSHMRRPELTAAIAALDQSTSDELVSVLSSLIYGSDLTEDTQGIADPPGDQHNASSRARSAAQSARRVQSISCRLREALDRTNHSGAHSQDFQC